MEDKQIFDMWETYKSLLKSTNREGIDSLIKWLDESDFKFAPASTKYHNAKRGGLLEHSLNVYYYMYDFQSHIQFMNISNETIIITALLHDICKTYFYITDYRNVKNEQGEWVKAPYFTVKDQFPFGHGEKSVCLIQNHIKLTGVEKMMIRFHMGFSKDDPMSVSNAFSMYPECLLLSFADQICTYVPESVDLKPEWKNKLLGRNLTESLQILSKPKEIEISGTKYTLAPEDAVVDGEKVVEMMVTQGEKIFKYKVFAPHGDGLPF